MRTALIMDIHLRASDIEVGGPVFLKACQSAQDNDCDTLIVGGDLFDSTLIGGRGASTGSVVAWAKRGLAAFKGKIYILLGNHELAGVGQAHALEVLRDLPDVEIIDRDTLLDIAGIKVAFLPYISPAHLFSKHPEWDSETRRDKFAHALDAVLTHLREATPDLFVGHCAIAGSIANKSGYRVFGNGNTMELRADQVLGVAPKVAWGDFHKRQAFSPDRPNDGYVGALRQLNFGEECNPTGYRLIDFATGEDRFIEIDSPKYFTVSTDEYHERIEEFQKLAADGHNIKVRGAEFPSTGFFEELQQGIRFERTAPQEAVQRRSDENFVADESPVDLLEKWHRHACPDVSLNELTLAYEQIAEGLELKSTGIGSLTRVRRIHLQNIAKHADTEIRFDDLEGVICIDGDNGAGKTTLIESVMLAIFGEAPSYGQDLYGMISQGHMGDALIEVEVETDGGVYVFQRCAHITAKTKSQDFTVLEVIDGSLKAVAGGPKRQAEGEAFAQALIGDKSLIMASVFAAQKAKDLIDYTPAERKDLLSLLLGSERFVPIAEAAKAKTTEFSKTISDRSAVIKAVSENLEPVDPLKVRITEIEEELEQCKDAIASTEEQREKLLEEKARVNANSEHTIVKQQISILDDEVSRLTRQMANLNLKIEERERDMKKLMQDALNADDPKKVQEMLDYARAAIRDSENQRQKAQNRRDEIQREIDKLQEQIREAERKHHNDYASWQRELNAAKRTFDSKVSDLERKRDHLTDDYDNACDKAELLDSDNIGCKGKLDCVFLKDAKEAKAKISGIQEQRDEVMQDLDYSDEWPEAKKIKEIESNEPKSASTEQLVERIKDLRASMPELPVVDRSEVEKLEKRLDAANASHNARAERKAKIDAGASLKTECDELKTTQMAKQKELNSLKQKLQGLADPQKAIAEVNEKLSKVNAELSELKASNEKLIAERSAKSSRLEHIDNEQARIKSIEAEVETYKSNANIYLTLCKAFGRDGIPQLILDTAIPRLAELSSQLLESAEYDGKLLFRTQGVTNGGKIREVLDILAWDGETGDFRDVSQFSGGEGAILRLAIRLAFGLLQAERAGKRIRVFVADESFAALKPHRALAALAMFDALKTRFQQIFVISHQNEVTAAIHQTVFVHKDNGISRVEVTNG